MWALYRFYWTNNQELFLKNNAFKTTTSLGIKRFVLGEIGHYVICYLSQFPDRISKFDYIQSQRSLTYKICLVIVKVGLLWNLNYSFSASTLNYRFTRLSGGRILLDLWFDLIWTDKNNVYGQVIKSDKANFIKICQEN